MMQYAEMLAFFGLTGWVLWRWHPDPRNKPKDYENHGSE